ncbi:PAS domain-containing protein [Pseudoduganella sp. UC29_106]|uniref:PAS domain-containing protein n=1 Tax=Pseudoduganella sp. UC29_106 TaxID=3374553 RepID=UPI0037583728
MLVADDGRITKVNAEALRVLGHHAQDVLEGEYLTLWTSDIGRQIAAACKAVMRTGAPTTLELSELREGTKDAWLEMRISNLKNHGLAIFFRDVTAQKC